MKTHYVKCWAEFMDDVWNGLKTAELRLNDRDYCVGDRVIMLKWCPDTNQFVREYVGYPRIEFYISHITQGFGLKDDYVMISFNKFIRSYSKRKPRIAP